MYAELQTLLQTRLNIIADHTFRDRDPAAHLEALKSTSEQIDSYAKAHHKEFDAKLRHYLSNCSYQKALDHLNT
jgi:hypothetical protein